MKKLFSNIKTAFENLYVFFIKSKPKGKQGIKHILDRVMIVVAVIVFFGSSFLLIQRVYGYYSDGKHNKEIQSLVPDTDPTDIFNEVTNNDDKNNDTHDNSNNNDDNEIDNTNQDSNNADNDINANNLDKEIKLPYKIYYGDMSHINEDGILKDYAIPKGMNDDMVGWIKMPGFNKEIKYPIVQTVDNDYYMHRQFIDKGKSYAGTIFMDYNNKSDEVDKHIILYGHAMKDMAMFGNLRNYSEKPEYYKKNTKIYVDLLDTRLEYEVFSTYIERSTYNYRQISFFNDIEHNNFLQRIKSKSVYDYGIELSANDKIITLSTCNDSEYKDGRTVVHARLARQIIYEEKSVEDDEADNFVDTEPEIITDVVVANVYLDKLVIQKGAPENRENVSYTPWFHTSYKEFEASVEHEVESINLNVKASDTESRLSFTKDGKTIDPEAVSLEVGLNTIDILVVSRDREYTRTYHILITREEGEVLSETEQQDDVNADDKADENEEVDENEEALTKTDDKKLFDNLIKERITNSQGVVELTYEPMPIYSLEQIEHSSDWSLKETLEVEDLTDMQLELQLYDVGDGVIKLLIKQSEQFYDIGADFASLDEVDITAISLSLIDENEQNQIIINIERNQYTESKVLLYKEEKWLCVLDTINLELMDLDYDGLDELVTTSKETVPAYLWVYRFRDGQFEKSDLVENTNSIYVRMTTAYLGKTIIQAGTYDNVSKYVYDDGKLVEVTTD